MQKNKRIFAAAVVFASLFSLAENSLAAPAISGVSGTVSNGNTVTISGSGFGTGPNIVLFDDFEKGTNGSNIKTGAGSAQVGKWDFIEGTRVPKYSNANKVSGTLAFRADMSSYWRELVTTHLPSSTKKIFMSWWTLIPSGTVLPGTGDPAGINWKNIWLQGEGTTDDDLVIPGFLGADSFLVTSNSLPYTRWFSLDFNIGQWKRISYYVNGGSGSNSGSFKFWELTSSGISQRINDNNVTILESGGVFEQICLNGYGRVTSNCYPTFDDVYIATGDNALARIEIGNNATYVNCTKLAVVTPDSWSTNSISAKVWQGNFVASEQAYLFIIDSTGTPSPGYPITFGSSGGGTTPPADTTAPAAPTGLSIS